MTRPISITMLYACAVLAVIVSGCSERMGKGWDWNRMRVQQKYQPYRQSNFFADGKTMQLPPEGTISREGGALLMPTAPLVITPAVIARGKAQFTIYCAVCHGERGDGNSIVARNMGPPMPPSLIVPPSSTLPAATIVSVITNGVARMPSFAAELSPVDRIAVAQYVKTMQHGVGATGDSTPHGGAPRP